MEERLQSGLMCHRCQLLFNGSITIYITPWFHLSTGRTRKLRSFVNSPHATAKWAVHANNLSQMDPRF